MTMPGLTGEPDYTLTILKEPDGWVVYAGGRQRSKPFPSEAEAKSWARMHELFYQPTCLGCGSAINRPEDPWEVVQASCSSGFDYMHRSCLEKFEAQLRERGAN